MEKVIYYTAVVIGVTIFCLGVLGIIFWLKILWENPDKDNRKNLYDTAKKRVL